MNYAKQVQERFYKENEDKAGTLISDLLPDITVLQALSLLPVDFILDGVWLIETNYPEEQTFVCKIDPTIALFKDQPEEVQKKISELLGNE